MFAFRGTEPAIPPGGVAKRTGLLAGFMSWFGIGQTVRTPEAAPAEDAPPPRADETPAARFSLTELEAAIEASMRSGTADLDAATREWARRERERRSGRSGRSRRPRHGPAAGASR